MNYEVSKCAFFFVWSTIYFDLIVVLFSFLLAQGGIQSVP